MTKETCCCISYKNGITPCLCGCHQDKVFCTKKVNRVELIDHTLKLEEGGGRCYVKWEDELDVTVQLQDDGRTLKVFIKPKE